MISTLIPGFTRVLGKRQGYHGLAVRDEIIDEQVNGSAHAMTTAWEPTPEELAKLNAGAHVHITLLGISHPPILVQVGDVPDDAGDTPV
jgi:hypothetical protein